MFWILMYLLGAIATILLARIYSARYESELTFKDAPEFYFGVLGVIWPLGLTFFLVVVTFDRFQGNLKKIDNWFDRTFRKK